MRYRENAARRKAIEQVSRIIVIRGLFVPKNRFDAGAETTDDTDPTDLHGYHIVTVVGYPATGISKSLWSRCDACVPLLEKPLSFCARADKCETLG